MGKESRKRPANIVYPCTMACLSSKPSKQGRCIGAGSSKRSKRGRGGGGGDLDLDLDLEADLKAHRMPGVEHDCIPNDSAYRLAEGVGVCVWGVWGGKVWGLDLDLDLGDLKLTGRLG